MEGEVKENIPEVDVSGFAEQLASSLVKETVQEAGAGVEGDWSIPCSSVCHQQHKAESDQGDDHGGEVTKRRSGSGQLCWTPESGASMETHGHSSGVTTGQCHESPVRRGVSVPNVSVDHVGDNVDSDHSHDQDTVSCSSDNIKSPRRGLLSSLGLRTKVKSTNNSQNNVRPKMKNFRKTISSIFSHKPRTDSSEPGANRMTNIFKLPSSVRHKLRPVDPCNRALPPVPPPRDDSDHDQHESLTPHHSPSLPINEAEQSDNMDFAASIEKVKDRGWYWGPLSGEAAERILSGEPDGSFVVRDSSDHHYIFSLTFKLNGFVRHVRIEHDQGNFSFGSFTRFKSTTIVEFIENAVEHSRSGRYLFFLHRRPVLGPMRVQLLHPVSRFKRVQSLQHLCRYVIVKVVRKDHLDQLPVPSRIKKYLNTPFYYSEQIAESEESSEANLEQLEDNAGSDAERGTPEENPPIVD